MIYFIFFWFISRKKSTPNKKVLKRPKFKKPELPVVSLRYL